MTSRVNAIDLARAAEWLRAFEGPDAECMRRVATWLDREFDRRIDAAEAYHAAKRNNVPLNLARKAVKRAKEQS